MLMGTMQRWLYLLCLHLHVFSLYQN